MFYDYFGTQGIHTVVSHWINTIEWRAIEVCRDSLQEKKLGHYS